MKPVRTIAIVGAGWSGLQIGKVLRDCGYDVSLIEELDDVGGTWHPARAYHGLSIHTPIFRCQFHDCDDLAGAHPLQRLPSRDLFEASRRFARTFGLYGITTFRHRVTHLEYSSREPQCRLTLQSLEDGSQSQREYDFVISTQFNSPRLPKLPGRAEFVGDVLHSNDVKTFIVDEIIAKNRKVTLLGGSKAAADLALALIERNYQFTWLMREMYWFMNYDKGYFDHKKGRPAALANRLIYFFGMKLLAMRPTVMLGFWFWRLAGLLHTPGRFHLDLRRFHHGWLDEQQVEMLRTRTHPVYGEIAALEPRHVRLEDGRRLECDVLICATGCDPLALPIELSIDGQPLHYEDAGPLYRYSVIPAIPRLCFTGFFNFGFGPLNGYHRAGWIMRYLEQKLSSEKLREIAARETPDLRPFQSAIFDSSDHFVLRSTEQMKLMLESSHPTWEVAEYASNYAVRFRQRPFRSLDAFIQARTKRGVAPQPRKCATAESYVEPRVDAAAQGQVGEN